MTARHLSLWQRRFLYAACLLVYGTGVLWIGAHYGQAQAGEFGERAPLESWALRLHGAAAIAFLIAFGSLLPRHVPDGLASRRNLWSGVLTLGATVLLATSAWGLYYLGAEGLRGWLSAGHWLLGIAAGPAVAVHALLGRRARRGVRCTRARRADGSPDHFNSHRNERGALSPERVMRRSSTCGHGATASNVRTPLR